MQLANQNYLMQKSSVSMGQCKSSLIWSQEKNPSLLPLLLQPLYFVISSRIKGRINLFYNLKLHFMTKQNILSRDTQKMKFEAVDACYHLLSIIITDNNSLLFAHSKQGSLPCHQLCFPLLYLKQKNEFKFSKPTKKKRIIQCKL